MQRDLDPTAASLVVRVHEELLKTFELEPVDSFPDPVAQLVLSLISSQTRDEVALVAANALRLRFGTWDAIRTAPEKEIERAIRAVTYSERKVKWLKSALNTIFARVGRLDLELLADMPVDRALAWLRGLLGVGAKVAASVLIYSSLRMPAMPVDSHHERVAKRLGLLPFNYSGARMHRRLGSQLPADWGVEEMEAHHTLMKQLGREFCRPRRPRCTTCPLGGICPKLDCPVPRSAPATSPATGKQLSFLGF